MDSLIVFNLESFSEHFQIDLAPVGCGREASVFRVARGKEAMALKVLANSKPGRFWIIYVISPLMFIWNDSDKRMK